MKHHPTDQAEYRKSKNVDGAVHSICSSKYIVKNRQNIHVI